MFQRILGLVAKDKNINFVATYKSSRGLHNGTSKRRSKFIGVLKNGFRWQVLINAGRVKKYIGTFWDEKEAAVVHDFFSIGLNGLKAKTNFSYSQDIIVEMIENYFLADRIFEPELVMSKVQ